MMPLRLFKFTYHRNFKNIINDCHADLNLLLELIESDKLAAREGKLSKQQLIIQQDRIKKAIQIGKYVERLKLEYGPAQRNYNKFIDDLCKEIKE